jgi:DNA mismatch endonuclease (patch repair protein)
MRGNRKVDTKPEIRLRQELFSRGLRYRKNAALTTGIGTIRPDLIFGGPRVAVFVDGCFWHSCPTHGTEPKVNRAYWESKLRRNRARDQRVTEALSAEGWLVVRIWEHQPIVEAADLVQAALATRN